MHFLGIKIDNLILEQARLKVRDFLVLPGQFKIFTPNPEMVVKAQKDKYFAEVLNGGDLNICDGFGLSLFSGIKRITGVDFMLEICQIAEETGKSIFLLGTNNEEILKKAAKELQKQFPKLKIMGYDKGPKISEHSPDNLTIQQFNNGSKMQYDKRENELVVDLLNKLKPNIVFVAFGMVKQEKWITENLSKMPSVKIAMGVGGALDYISGAVPRAPLFLRKIGLEWLCRLFCQPQRFERIFNATVRFIFLVLKDKIL